MTNKWIILDLDDTVFNFRQAWYEASHKEGNKIPHHSEWPNFHNTHYYGYESQDQLQEMFIRQRCVELSEPEKGAREAINHLREQGFLIGALSARSWLPNAHEITLDAFKRHNLDFDKLIISGLHTESKTVHASKFGEIYSVLDDSIKHITDFKNIGVEHSYLKKQSWNKQAPEQLHAFEDLMDFAHYISSEHSKDKNKSFKP